MLLDLLITIKTFTGATRLQGQQGAKHKMLAAHLSRVQMERKALILCWVFQGERGDCGAPGEKGNIVGTLFISLFFL